MLKNLIVFPVDELYLNIVEEGKVSRLGINNGIVVEPIFADPKHMVPKNTVRILASLANLPLILAARKTYEVPVEVAPLTELVEGVSSVRDAIIKTRNGHRSCPANYPLGFREVSEQDMYAYGLAYNLITRKLKIQPHKFTEADLDLVMETKYIDEAHDKHAMSDLFACEHVEDFCAVMMDPRMHMGPGGNFKYPDVPKLLGFGSFELACQLTRKFIELHGDDPLPADGASMRQLFQKVTGRMEALVGHPTQLLGARVLHNILTTPMDNLGVSVKSMSTRLARDSEVAKQRLHFLVNEWMRRLDKDNWVSDEYSPDLFEIKEDA